MKKYCEIQQVDNGFTLSFQVAKGHGGVAYPNKVAKDLDELLDLIRENYEPEESESQK